MKMLHQKPKNFNKGFFFLRENVWPSMLLSGKKKDKKGGGRKKELNTS